MSLQRSTMFAALATALLAGAQPAQAAEVLKIGISAGLTGYAATVDRAWRDGVQLAADELNAKGGVMGRKVEVVVEDNRSEPQEAVTAYRKMLSSDGVDVFISGCVSAGNFAAATMVAKAEKPMMLCSILPQQASQVKWAFTTLPPAGFEVEKRFEYLRDKTQIRKVGVLHDPTPYALLQKSVAEKVAGKYGLEVVDVESYKQDDADLSVQINKIQAAGAGAVIKIGLGGTTLTAAKNMKQLGSTMLLLTSLEDLAVFKPVAEVLGDRFFFVASPSQVFESLPDSGMKTEIARFLDPWRAKYGDRDPNWASRGWDGVMLTVAAIQAGKSAAGPSVRDQIEKIDGFQGTTGAYRFSADNHQGITQNPFVLATIAGNQVKIVQ
ncbi:ABC transporter substrate-binding protein [Azospirillum sp. RWY-5-1]|uniref:ABC transporter substrate-binding protein n=1 Tax=Azospirillum oleiclasticum TaxID=2735135 RepID=A0ABX2TFS8_9PROT|nr:ABC transporter substrate-binding protein [Azospirillum oleiclasticum]NYZ14456.1 ABC transporter substrate-binding protein [Azospirillum oleiclasticum]NYZ23192.1 ABC transporter substrate-binding protein [Azospirillum oleiclasticum]